MAVGSLNALADAGALQAKFSQLREPLRNNVFHRPIVIESEEAGDTLKGDVFAVLNHPYENLSKSLQNPADWCAIMILPFNTKACQPVRSGNGATLAMRIGRKADQPADEAYKIDFSLQPVASGADYFESRLTAGQGPVGTRDYRIVVEAIPLEGGKRTFMHLSYQYAYGGMGRFAMQTYLSTAGAHKVGFSTVKDENGQPALIGGVRGAIERNVMRYYLAVDAHLASLDAPPADQLQKRLETWFDSAERYPRQLHEMDRQQYLALKKGEAGRQPQQQPQQQARAG
jgi:hypothetical protein